MRKQRAGAFDVVKRILPTAIAVGVLTTGVYGFCNLLDKRFPPRVELKTLELNLREVCATKSDVDKMNGKLDAIHDEVNTIARSVARLEAISEFGRAGFLASFPSSNTVDTRWIP